jgi:uncharacterized membrane protein YhhN
MFKKYPRFSITFMIIFGLEIFAIVSANQELRYFSKPLICISLLLFMWATLKTRSKFSNRVMVGLFFSLLGDVFLMIPGGNSKYFMLGLGSFLTAHILYISAFYLDTIKRPDVEVKRFVLPIFLVFGFFCLSYYTYLRPYLGSMTTPVLVYCFAISLMAIMAALRYGRVNSRSFVFILVGAILFIISDSLLAYNKFVEKWATGNLLVMVSYMMAQFSIVLGTVERKYIKS